MVFLRTESVASGRFAPVVSSRETSWPSSQAVPDRASSASRNFRFWAVFIGPQRIGILGPNKALVHRLEEYSRVLSSSDSSGRFFASLQRAIGHENFPQA